MKSIYEFWLFWLFCLISNGSLLVKFVFNKGFRRIGNVSNSTSERTMDYRVNEAIGMRMKGWQAMQGIIG